MILEMRQLGPGFVQQVQKECPSCKGKGKVISQLCPHCNGKRILPTEEEIDIDIEKGMDSGSEIIFHNEADANPDVKSGHLIFNVQSKPHSLFSRQGNDLHMNMYLTLSEALVGFSKSFIHLDGREVNVKSISVTQAGEVRTIKGEGMPKTNDPTETGNLHVKYHVICK